MVARRVLVILVPLLVIAAVAGAMLARQLHPRSSQTPLSSGTWLPAGRPLPDVTLVDQDGAAFTPAQLRGAPSLLFFGFTHCPDVCPTTLMLLTQLARTPSLPGVRVVFVTVDPQRDDAATMKRYVNAFGPEVTGLTGEPAQLQTLMKGIGVASLRQDLPGGDYTMDHSAAVFLLGADARIAALFTPPLSLPALTADLKLAAASFAAAPQP